MKSIYFRTNKRAHSDSIDEIKEGINMEKEERYSRVICEHLDYLRRSKQINNELYIEIQQSSEFDNIMDMKIKNGINNLHDYSEVKYCNKYVQIQKKLERNTIKEILSLNIKYKPICINDINRYIRTFL